MKFKRLLNVGLMALLCAGTATAVSRLNSVQMTPSANTATVNLRTTGSYAHKEYRPDEHLMLVDLTGVTADAAVERMVELNSPVLKGYKLSVYTSASGGEVTRIELMLGNKVTADVKDESDGLKILLSNDGSVPSTVASASSIGANSTSPSSLSSQKSAQPSTASTLPSYAVPVAKSAATSTPTPAPVEHSKARVATPGAAASALGSTPATPMTTAPTAIRNISVQRGHGTLDVIIEGPSSARPFLLKSPDRLVVDFSNAVVKSSLKNISVRSKDVLQVRVGKFQLDPPVTRIVIDLSGPREFDLIASDRQVIVRIKSEEAVAVPAPVKAAPAPVLASAELPAVAGHPNSSKSPVVNEALASATRTPGAAVTMPASATTSQLRDQSASEPKVRADAASTTIVAKPAPSQPKVEPSRFDQSTPIQVVKPAEVRVDAAATPTPIKPAVIEAKVSEPTVTGPQVPEPKITDSKIAEPKIAEPKVAVSRSEPTAPVPAPKPAEVRADVAAEKLAPAPASQPKVELARLDTPALPQSVKSAEAPHSTAKYTGEPISVNLKDVDLKDFFRLIHEISGLNIVLDPNVKGSLTLVLDDVPWDQALDIVLKNNALDRELQGNVLRIAATDTLRKEAVDRRAQSEAVALAVDRQTITRFLSYAKSKDVVPTIKKFLTARGDVISDERTNALIISDIPSVLPALDRLLSQLDRKSQEVEIEVRVVSATRSFTRDLGVQLGFSWQNGVSSLGGLTSLTSSTTTSSTTGTTTTTSTNPGTVPLFSNYPATNPTTGFQFSNGSKSYGLDAVLTAAENHNLAKILSRPRVVTQSNVKAEVKQGVKIPVYTQGTGNANASVTYVDAVLRLSVTPQITADNTIFLTVDVENTQPSGTINSNYILTTQQATTQVLVSDGGTVVIGGVIQTTNTVSTSQTPFLGNIPWLGNLFKERAVKTETDELIFFITPKIIQT